MKRQVPTALLLVLFGWIAAACVDRTPFAPPQEPESLAAASPGMSQCALHFSDAEVRAEIEALHAAVNALEASRALNGGQARALRDHLNNALSRLSAGQYCPFRSQLGAFREQLENFLRDGVLQEGQARPLIRVVNRLLNDRPPELRVDGSIAPVAATIPGIEGGPPRPVARFRNAQGRDVDFVANELYLMTSDPAERNAFLSRWNGTVLLTMDFAALGLGGRAPVYLVRLDPSAADVQGLPERWMRSAGLNGENFVSSEAGLKLLAAAVEEAADRGLKVGINFLLASAPYADRTTAEASAAVHGGYSPDAFTWPYMNRGSPQNIGTAEAWRVLESMGRLGNRVRIGIADGGFIPNADFPAAQTILPSGGLRVRNPDPGHCGSGEPTPSCTWHGTHVTMAAMARPDNEFGAAGPAGPIGDVVMLQSPSTDFFAVMHSILSSMPAALASGPRIINISASTALETELCLLAVIGVPICETLHGIAGAFRAAGALVVAAAGNQGHNVDATKVFGVWPFEFVEEAHLTIPCELTSVLCVGGLDWNATTRHADSNWGSNPASLNTVRIFGPFSVWSVADAEAADVAHAEPDGTAGLVHGTSFASPYVAGVAALVWAANPSLSASQVENILLSTAHTGSPDGRVPRWVNALGAVQRAVGGNTPPYIGISSPLDGARHPRGRVAIQFSADVEDLEGDPVVVTWRSDRDGVIGTGPFFTRANLSFGLHRITATASDGTFTTTSRTIEIEVYNEPPVIQLLMPDLSQIHCFPRRHHFLASVTDRNNPPLFTVPEANVTWYTRPYSDFDIPGVLPPDAEQFGVGFEASRQFTSTFPQWIYIRAVDEQGAVALFQQPMQFRHCAGTVPRVTILEPSENLRLDDVDGFDPEVGRSYNDIRVRGEASYPNGTPVADELLTWSTRFGTGAFVERGHGRELNLRLHWPDCAGGTYTIRLEAPDTEGGPSDRDQRTVFLSLPC